MRIIVELAPSRNRRALEEVLKSLGDLVDTVFFPEAPLGNPSVFAMAWAWIARSMGFRSFASVRLCDLNLNALISIARAAEVLDLEGMLIVRGDPPRFGKCVAEVSSEEAQREAEDTTRRLAREEGIFCGVSSGGAVAGMLRLSKEVENAVIVAIICDRGDRYLSTGIFDEPN